LWGDFRESQLQYRIDLGRAGAAFDERGHGEVWGVQGGVDGHKSFLWGPGFPILSKRITRRFEASWCRRKLSAGRGGIQWIHRKSVLDGSVGVEGGEKF